MILSKRERLIGYLTVAVLVLLTIDRYALTPLLETRERLQMEVSAKQIELERANRLFANHRRMNYRWNEMLTGGLKGRADEAENQALHALRDWAQESGLSLSLLKPERTEKHKQFQQITIRATGTGSMQSVSQFLWRIQTASIPVRVTDMLITARREGMDDLSLQLGVSTLYLPPEPPKSGKSDSAGVGPVAAAIRMEGRR